MEPPCLRRMARMVRAMRAEPEEAETAETPLTILRTATLQTMTPPAVPGEALGLVMASPLGLIAKTGVNSQPAKTIHRLPPAWIVQPITTCCWVIWAAILPRFALLRMPGSLSAK